MPPVNAMRFLFSTWQREPRIGLVRFDLKFAVVMATAWLFQQSKTTHRLISKALALVDGNFSTFPQRILCSICQVAGNARPMVVIAIQDLRRFAAKHYQNSSDWIDLDSMSFHPFPISYRFQEFRWFPYVPMVHRRILMIGSALQCPAVFLL